jgi:hypothetical protein
MRLSSALREVERELQTARLKSVATNRPMRVRFNCPASGQFRMVEITGDSTTDLDANRCDAVRFPYPGPKDSNPATPEVDGPVRTLRQTITLSGTDIQFTSRGTAEQVVSGTAQEIAVPIAITVTQGSKSLQVFVNGLGKINVQ